MSPAAAAGLVAALLCAACGGGERPDDRDLRIAGGVKGGVYIRYGEGLAAAVREDEPWLRAGILRTDGSVENVELLRRGCADLAFVAADVAADRHRAESESSGDDPPLVALARLYDEYVQLVTRDGSGIDSVADLGRAGVRVSLGAPGSGTAVIAKRVLEAAGLEVAAAGPADPPPSADGKTCPVSPPPAPGPAPATPEGDCQTEPGAAATARPSALPRRPSALPLRPSALPSTSGPPRVVLDQPDEVAGPVRDLGLNLSQSVAQLAVGRLDAFFWSGGLPACPIRDLARDVDIRLVDLGAEAELLAGDRRYSDFYTPTTIPASAYDLPGVRTVAVPNYLVALEDADRELAYAVTRVLFRSGPVLAAYAADARRLDIRSALSTRPLKLHPGAVQYYQEAHGG